MTLNDMVTEVCLRAGEGYTNYTTRAMALIRFSLAQALSSGAIPVSEIDGSAKTITSVSDTLPHTPGSFNGEITVIPAIPAQTTLLYNRIDVQRLSGNLIFSQLTGLRDLNIAIAYQNITSGIPQSAYKEIVYFIDNPKLYFCWAAAPEVGAKINYQRTQISVPTTSFTTISTQFNTLMNERMQQVLIDLASKALIDEINR